MYANKAQATLGPEHANTRTKERESTALGHIAVWPQQLALSTKRNNSGAHDGVDEQVTATRDVVKRGLRLATNTLRERGS